MGNKVLDYEIVDNISQLLESKIIIYGTSTRAEHLYQLIKKANLNIAACCDGSEKKIGNKFHEWQIESFTEVSKRICLENVIIIICSTFVEEIMADCSKTCAQELSFVTSFGFRIAFLLNRNNSKLSTPFREWYSKQYNMWLHLKRKEKLGVAWWQYNANLLKFMESAPVLVYQMGKVGSSGIYNSLQTAHVESIHIHYFLPWNNVIPEYEYESYLENMQQIIQQKEKIKIITLLRDPAARDISAVFQSLSNPSVGMYNLLSEKLIDSIIEIMDKEYNHMDSDMKISGLNNVFLKRDCSDKKEKASVYAWFDMELKEVFGIDVYAYPFDKEKGYSIIKQDNIECLVIKLEKLNACYDIIGEFVGKKGIMLQGDNVGENKPYGYLYKEVKKKISIPEDILDYYYGGKEIRHFYSEEEIEQFKNKWKR